MQAKLTDQKIESIKSNIENIDLYINGEFIPAYSNSSFVNINPFTNQRINSVAEGREEDIKKAAAAAKEAYRNGPWGKMKVSERLTYLYRIADIIDQEIERIAVLEALDTGLPVSQTKKQTARSAENFRFYARMAETRLHGEAYQADDEFINYTIYKPVGVVGLITPWNAPFMLETWKVAPALAAGNTVILKPAELSPISAHLLAQVIDKAGLPKGVFNVVHGFGERAGASLVENPDVNAISFTGETSTGTVILKNAADTLKRTSMELGGKSPLIIFEDCEFERALDAAVWGIFSFNGERCTANSRVFVHKKVKERFIEALKRRVSNIKIGDPMDTATELGPLINKEHVSKVNSYIELAKKEGCDVFQGNVPPEAKAGNFVPATVLLHARNEMKVCQEEIFGPVMAVIEFEEEHEVIAAANDVKYGLAGYVWTNDIKRGHRVAQAVDAGMIWINAQNVRDLRIPFGGTKSSGIGREGGHYALLEFYSEPKVIHVATNDHHIPQFGK